MRVKNFKAQGSLSVIGIAAIAKTPLKGRSFLYKIYEVAYGTEYGIIFNSCGYLHAKLYDEELQEIRNHPENYFVAIISVHGE